MKINLIGVTILASLGLNVFLYVELRGMIRRSVEPSELDRIIVQRAWELRARETRQSVNEAQIGRFPVVMGINDWRCVDLRLERDWLGSGVIILF